MLNILTGFDATDFIIESDVDCQGPQLLRTYSNVPSLEYCASLCHNHPGCASADYEASIEQCQVKGQCVNKTMHVGRTTLTKTEGGRTCLCCFPPQCMV